MTTIELSNDVELRICSNVEWNGYCNCGKYPKITKDGQMYYLYGGDDMAGEKDLFLVKGEGTDKNTLMSNIIRVLSSHKLGDVAGKFEDGENISDNETASMSAEFESDMKKLMSELRIRRIDVTSIINDFKSKLSYILNEAKRGNILTEEETDHTAFDFASDLYKLLETK